MPKLRLLDLFCGAGGCSRGYQQAGFHVTGIDIIPQPRYAGDDFICDDAMIFCQKYGGDFDVIHASPPCQAYSITRKIHAQKPREALLPVVRELLQKTGKPWVIENVMGAPLHWPIMLCGTMFGLSLYRHRLFESSLLLFAPDHETHPERVPQPGRGASKSGYITVAGHFANMAAAKKAMGIDWMNRHELAQAIPQAYTEWVGVQLYQRIQRENL
jgi:DNA (cytosine-5)-methyltransferase 1